MLPSSCGGRAGDGGMQRKTRKIYEECPRKLLGMFEEHFEDIYF
jgi:hypothetical protein